MPFHERLPLLKTPATILRLLKSNQLNHQQERSSIRNRADGWLLMYVSPNLYKAGFMYLIKRRARSEGVNKEVRRGRCPN